MATPQLTIVVKKSKRTGLIYWVMTGTNSEKMAHSEGIENMTYFRSLMKRFAKMGFIIINTTKAKL